MLLYNIYTCIFNIVLKPLPETYTLSNLGNYSQWSKPVIINTLVSYQPIYNLVYTKIISKNQWYWSLK